MLQPALYAVCVCVWMEVQSKVRVMLSKDGVLAVLRCGDDAPSCESGWPLDAPTTVWLSFHITMPGDYAINLF